MRRRQASLPALLALLVLGPAVRAQEEGLSSSEIRRVWASNDSLVRHEAWKKLNAEESRQYRILVKILGSRSWFDRDGAIIALAKAATDDTIAKMVKDLRRHSNPYVRQGMAMALAKMNDPKFYEHLYEALDDKDPFVRRVAVHALRVHKKPDAVDALVERFQDEDDPVVRSFLEHSLNELTQAFLGPNPVRWLSWWTQAKADPDYKLGKTDEEAVREAERLGRKLRQRKTVSIAGGVTLDSAERGSGKGVPILIIPPYNYSKQIMLPFLSELERNHRLHYIDLPPISSFKNLRTVSEKRIPYYPTEQLVEAFEDLRKATKEDHFAIMACGMNSWIAMDYARLYPQSVAAMVFVAPISSVREYGAATTRFQSNGRQKKDDEMLFFGLSRQFNSRTGESALAQHHREKEVPERDGEGASIDRRSWTLFFKDERDSVISMLYPVKNHPMGTVAIPDYHLTRKDPPSVRIPTLVICGEASLYTSPADCKAIGKYYRGATLLYRNSSCMPFVEECEKFNKDVGLFLRKYARRKSSSRR